MKTLITAAAATALMATSAFAQATQTGVVGQSGNATYPLQVTASDGNTYNCSADIRVVQGVARRTCVNANASGLGELGSGITAGGAAALFTLVVLAATSGGSSSTTTTN